MPALARKGKDGSDSLEALFEQRRVDEVRQVEQRARREAEEKREELRNAVGSAYKDLLAGSDHVHGMLEKSESLVNRLGEAVELAEGLNHEPEAEPKEPEGPSRELLEEAARARRALESPEAAWAAMDEGRLAEAAMELEAGEEASAALNQGREYRLVSQRKADLQETRQEVQKRAHIARREELSQSMPAAENHTHPWLLAALAAGHFSSTDLLNDLWLGEAEVVAGEKLDAGEPLAAAQALEGAWQNSAGIFGKDGALEGMVRMKAREAGLGKGKTDELIGLASGQPRDEVMERGKTWLKEAGERLRERAEACARMMKGMRVVGEARRSGLEGPSEAWSCLLENPFRERACQLAEEGAELAAEAPVEAFKEAVPAQAALDRVEGRLAELRKEVETTTGEWEKDLGRRAREALKRSLVGIASRLASMGEEAGGSEAARAGRIAAAMAGPPKNVAGFLEEPHLQSGRGQLLGAKDRLEGRKRASEAAKEVASAFSSASKRAFSGWASPFASRASQHILDAIGQPGPKATWAVADESGVECPSVPSSGVMAALVDFAAPLAEEGGREEAAAKAASEALAEHCGRALAGQGERVEDSCQAAFDAAFLGMALGRTVDPGEVVRGLMDPVDAASVEPLLRLLAVQALSGCSALLGPLLAHASDPTQHLPAAEPAYSLAQPPEPVPRFSLLPAPSVPPSPSALSLKRRPTANPTSVASLLATST